MPSSTVPSSRLQVYDAVQLELALAPGHRGGDADVAAAGVVGGLEVDDRSGRGRCGSRPAVEPRARRRSRCGWSRSFSYWLVNWR